MATDFDDRIDIIPVSDPNIFSMSQRVMLAQEMLKMVQSNPQIHGRKECTMRISACMKRWVFNSRPVLPPPPQPQPTTPSLENSTMLQAQPAQHLRTRIMTRTLLYICRCTKVLSRRMHLQATTVIGYNSSTHLSAR